MEYPSNAWMGVIQSTMPLYLRDLVDLTMRERLLLALMRRKGRVKLNDSGYQCNWRVKMSLPPTETWNDGAVVDYSNHNSKQTLAIDWRGYQVRDTFTLMQEAMNTGEAQLVNEFQEKLNNLSQSIREAFCAELYLDGQAAGRSRNIHGLETFLGAHATVTAADRIAMPSDTYGLSGASTVLGNLGGFWSAAGADPNNVALGSNWPDGQGSTEYDYLSPKLVNYSSTAWGTSSATFEDNSWRVTSAMIDWITHTASLKGKPDIIIYPNDMYRAYKNHQEAITRNILPHPVARDLGFPDTLNHEGVMIHKDFDCPAAVGYAFNVDYMQLRSLMPQLFFQRGPALDPHTGFSKLILAGFLGNVTYSPKHFAKTAAYA